MHSDDQEFLERLGGELQPGRGWKIFSRRGRALLVMPAAASSLKAGARLYSPQRFLAKIASRFSLTVPFVWRAIPAIGWKVDAAGPLGRIIHELGVEVDAILLGNPSQEARRALILTKGKEPLVMKVGVGKSAAKVVKREAEFIESQGDSCEEIPEILKRASGENWECFGIPYLEGGDVSIVGVCETLNRWWSGESVLMSTLPSWHRLESSDDRDASMIMKACAELELRPARSHGDLAPWNVRFRESGEIAMIDWEDGQMRDVPCWDLVHFLFQQLVLVERIDSEEVMERIQNFLVEPPARDLLSQAGWAGREGLLFASYLIAIATEKDEAQKILRLLHVKESR